MKIAYPIAQRDDHRAGYPGRDRGRRLQRLDHLAWVRPKEWDASLRGEQPACCCPERGPSGDPMDGKRNLERVRHEGPGEGYLVPNDGGQKHELLPYERRKVERAQEITVRFLGSAGGTNTQGEGNTP